MRLDHADYFQYKLPFLKRGLVNPLKTIEAKATEIVATIAAEATQLPDKTKGLAGQGLEKIIPTGSSVGTLRGCLDIDGAKCLTFNFLSVVLWLTTVCLIMSSSLCASTYLVPKHRQASQTDRFARVACKARLWTSAFLSVGALFSSVLMFFLIRELLNLAEDLNRALPGTVERGFLPNASIAILVCAALHVLVTPLFYDNQQGGYN